jgi:hypothetical protein
MTNRSRFYIPLKSNSIGEIQYEKILIDCGCSSILLPFPEDRGSILKEKYLNRCRFVWDIAKSKGTGAAHSPVLKIKPLVSLVGFPCVLAGNEQDFSISLLRFHLGSKSAECILNDEEMKEMLKPQDIATLEAVVEQLKKLREVRRKNASMFCWDRCTCNTRSTAN